MMRHIVSRSRIYRFARSLPFRLHLDRPVWECPVCNFTGRFKTVAPPAGKRVNAKCPYCASLERHRLQYLVVKALQEKTDFSGLSILHVAPESFLQELLRGMFSLYKSADLVAKGVDFHFDLCNIPLPDSSYDVVYASHVMEHIRDDGRALSEIRRILRPGGIAILPVPVLGETTVEYDAPNPTEFMHVRATGLDYFEKYRSVFPKVDVYSSVSFADKYQTCEYEDRAVYPTKLSSQRRPMAGERHMDYVPVCYVEG